VLTEVVVLPRCTMVVPPYMAWLGEQREQRPGIRPVTRLLQQASGGQVRGTGHIGSTPRTRKCASSLSTQRGSHSGYAGATERPGGLAMPWETHW